MYHKKNNIFVILWRYIIFIVLCIILILLQQILISLVIMLAQIMFSRYILRILLFAIILSFLYKPLMVFVFTLPEKNWDILNILMMKWWERLFEFSHNKTVWKILFVIIYLILTFWIIWWIRTQYNSHIVRKVIYSLLIWIDFFGKVFGMNDLSDTAEINQITKLHKNN